MISKVYGGSLQEHLQQASIIWSHEKKWIKNTETFLLSPSLIAQWYCDIGRQSAQLLKTLTFKGTPLAEKIR